MKTAKPFEIIASRFQISNESAKYFLLQVQKSFKGERPPQAFIIQFMSGLQLERLPKPYAIASMMSEQAMWAGPLNSEPHTLQDEEDMYTE
jgi:hypothetical protein